MKQEDILLETFDAAIRRFPNLVHIELQGEGEPLLHRQFFDMVKRARERGIKVSLITNGSLFDARDHVSKLLESGIEKVSISIESADPSRFKSIRGGNLHSVVSGAKALVGERRMRALSKPLVDLAVTVLKSTIDDYPGIVRLYRDLKLDGGINTQLLQPMEPYMEHYDEQLVDELVTTDGEVRFRALRTEGERQIGPPVKVGFYKELFLDQDQELNTCPWLEKAVFVNVSGEMAPCCKIKDAKRYSYGQVGEPSILRYTNTREEMRQQLHRGEVPQPCRGCPGAEPFRGRPDRIERNSPATGGRLPPTHEAC